MSEVSSSTPAYDIDGLARNTTALHNEKGGSTFSPRFGQVSETNKFSVSEFPGREVKVPGKTITEQQVREFIAANRDVLDQSNTNLGSWYNPADGTTYLDVSRMVDSLDEAIALGQKHNQLAIYDHKNATMVDVPKTGTPMADPAVTQLAGAVPPEFHAIEAHTGPGPKGREVVSPERRQDVVVQKAALDAFRVRAAEARQQQPPPLTSDDIKALKAQGLTTEDINKLRRASKGSGTK